ncbi:MAG: ATP-binding protein [Nitrospirae bacterium]|nr:ATP-binding protein [Nitrospirota bacterium]
MPPLVYEQVFRNFSLTLKNNLNRELTHYSFEAWEGFQEDKLILLKDFLIAEKIPFEVAGMPGTSEEELPHRTIVERNERLFSAGLFVIYPGTENEVIVGVFRLMGPSDTDSHYVIAYRNEEIFKWLILNLQVFHRGKLRQDGMIEVYSGSNIPLPDVTWADIILPEETKQDIRNNIEGFIKGEEIYRRLNIPYKRGFLFAGPPGNGKTMLLKVIASTYRELKFVLYKKRGHSGNGDIDRVFALATELAPCVLCFEDLDSLFNGEIMLSHFLNKLDGFETSEGIMILATTNHPEELDPALTSRPSRFDRLWMFRNPDYSCRQKMLRHLFGQQISGVLVEHLAEQTNNFSMVYLKELYVSASLVAIDAGKSITDEDDINKALGLLRKQFGAAKRQFISVEKEVGFGHVCARD